MDHIDTFLEHLRASGRRPNTIAQRERHLRAYAASGCATPVEFLNPPRWRGKSATTMNAVRSSLRVFFEHAVAAGWEVENPMRLVKGARTPAATPRPVEGELRTDGLPREDRLLIALLRDAGLRLGEAVALRGEDFDFAAGTIRIRETKSGGEQLAILPACITAAPPPGRIFPFGVRHAQRRLARHLPPGITAHSLRHTFATRLYETTGDINLVKQAMRHRSIASTLIYARLPEHRLRTAIDRITGTRSPARA